MSSRLPDNDPRVIAAKKREEDVRAAASKNKNVPGALDPADKPIGKLLKKLQDQKEKPRKPDDDPDIEALILKR